jgi:hypothetical protein
MNKQKIVINDFKNRNPLYANHVPCSSSRFGQLSSLYGLFEMEKAKPNAGKNERGTEGGRAASAEQNCM